MGLRNLTYLWATYAMFASDGRHTSLAEVGPVVAALCLVDILVPTVQFIEHRINPALLNEVGAVSIEHHAGDAGRGGVAGAGPQPLCQRVEQFAPDVALARFGAGGGVGV
jgi:hypothetical protein